MSQTNPTLIQQYKYKNELHATRIQASNNNFSRYMINYLIQIILKQYIQAERYHSCERVEDVQVAQRPV